jgi:hypothetical protein
MTPDVTLSDGTFARLQSHAVPLVDTIETVIAKALDALEGLGGAPTIPASTVRAFNPAAPPPLSFTTPKSISLDGKTFPKNQTYWNHLMYACARAAAAKGLSAKEIYALTVVPASMGRKEDNGFTFIPEAGISIQGQDANVAWKQAYHFAHHLGLKLEVAFTWQNVEKAAMPNVTGSFAVG